MGTSRTSRQPVNLLVEVTRAADGRPEGRIRTARSERAYAFSGVLELLKVLEDLLDDHQSTPVTTPPSEKDTP
jgi:hypothetical protein